MDRGQPPGIELVGVQGHLVGRIGQHIAVADQEAHRLAAAPLQQLGGVEALQGAPEAVAALEVAFAARLQVDGVGNEAAAGS